MRYKIDNEIIDINDNDRDGFMAQAKEMGFSPVRLRSYRIDNEYFDVPENQVSEFMTQAFSGGLQPIDITGTAEEMESLKPQPMKLADDATKYEVEDKQQELLDKKKNPVDYYNTKISEARGRINKEIDAGADIRQNFNPDNVFKAIDELRGLKVDAELNKVKLDDDTLDYINTFEKNYERLREANSSGLDFIGWDDNVIEELNEINEDAQSKIKKRELIKKYDESKKTSAANAESYEILKKSNNEQIGSIVKELRGIKDDSKFVNKFGVNISAAKYKARLLKNKKSLEDYNNHLDTLISSFKEQGEAAEGKKQGIEKIIAGDQELVKKIQKIVQFSNEELLAKYERIAKEHPEDTYEYLKKEMTQDELDYVRLVDESKEILSALSRDDLRNMGFHDKTFWQGVQNSLNTVSKVVYAASGFVKGSLFAPLFGSAMAINLTESYLKEKPFERIATDYKTEREQMQKLKKSYTEKYKNMTINEIEKETGSKRAAEIIYKSINMTDADIEKQFDEARQADLKKIDAIIEVEVNNYLEKSGLGYNVGKVATDMLSFMGQLKGGEKLGEMIKDISGTIKSKFAKEGAQEVSETLIKKGVANKIKELTGKLMKSIAAAEGDTAAQYLFKAGIRRAINVLPKEAAMAALSLPLQSAILKERYDYEKMLRVIDFTEDKDGNLKCEINITDRDEMWDVIKLVGDMYIENLSERGGNLWGVKDAGKRLGEHLSKSGLKKLGKLFAEMNGDNVVSKFLSEGNFHGISSEYLEERFGDALRVIVGLDDHKEGEYTEGWGKRFVNALFPDYEQVKTELIAFALPNAPGYALSGIRGTDMYLRKNAVRKALASTTDEDLKKKIDEISILIKEAEQRGDSRAERKVLSRLKNQLFNYNLEQERRRSQTGADQPQAGAGFDADASVTDTAADVENEDFADNYEQGEAERQLEDIEENISKLENNQDKLSDVEIAEQVDGLEKDRAVWERQYNEVENSDLPENEKENARAEITRNIANINMAINNLTGQPQAGADQPQAGAGFVSDADGDSGNKGSESGKTDASVTDTAEVLSDENLKTENNTSLTEEEISNNETSDVLEGIAEDNGAEVEKEKKIRRAESDKLQYKIKKLEKLKEQAFEQDLSYERIAEINDEIDKLTAEYEALKKRPEPVAEENRYSGPRPSMAKSDMKKIQNENKRKLLPGNYYLRENGEIVRENDDNRYLSDPRGVSGSQFVKEGNKADDRASILNKIEDRNQKEKAKSLFKRLDAIDKEYREAEKSLKKGGLLSYLRGKKIQRSNTGYFINELRTLIREYGLPTNIFSKDGMFIDRVAQSIALDHPEWGISDSADLIEALKNPGDYLTPEGIAAQADMDSLAEEYDDIMREIEDLTNPGQTGNDGETGGMDGTDENDFTNENEGENGEGLEPIPFQLKKKTRAEKTSLLKKLVKRLNKIFGNKVYFLNNDEIIAKMNEIGGNNASLIKDKNNTPIGFYYKGEVYINIDKADAETPIHEFGHIWLSWIKENAGELYKRGLELMSSQKGVKNSYYERVVNNPEYKSIIEGITDAEKRENYILEEALALAIGEQGKSIVEAELKNKFKTWLKEMFQAVKKFMKGLVLGDSEFGEWKFEEYTPEQIAKMSLEEFVSGSAERLLSGQGINEGFSEKLKKLIEKFKNEIDRNILNEEQKGIYDVVIGNKSKSKIRKNDLDDLQEYVLIETGNKKMGMKHIILEHYSGDKGQITANEILNIGDIIRRGKLNISENKHIYELYDNNIRYRVVVGVNGKKETVITYYSNKKGQNEAGHGALTSSARDLKTNVSGFNTNISQESGNVKGENEIIKLLADSFGIDYEQLKKEFDETRAKYEGTPLWLKAPNGKDSNLNEHLWVMVRTPRFKEWFGDWESYNSMQELDNKKTVDIQGNEIPRFEKISELIDYLSKNIKSESDNKFIGKVLTDKRAIKNTLNHGMNKNKVAAFAGLNELIKNAIILNVEKKGNQTGYILGSNLKIGNNDYKAFILVRKDEKTQRLYVHEVVDIKKLHEASLTRTTESDESSGPRGVIYNIAQKILNVKGENVSKVVDENGEPLVVYHGTPNAEFNIFKENSIFTKNKMYADRYQNQGASSLSYKKEARKPDTYSVFLSIKKMFDTRNKREKKIFETEYQAMYSPNLTEKGLIDWMEATDFIEWLKENYPEYDGIMVDEGGEPAREDSPYTKQYEHIKNNMGWRGIGYIPFNSNQIKSVENAGSFSEATGDIRFMFAESLPARIKENIVDDVTGVYSKESFEKDTNKRQVKPDRVVGVLKLLNMNGINKGGPNLAADYVLWKMLEAQGLISGRIYKQSKVSDFAVIFDEGVSRDQAERELKEFVTAARAMSESLGLKDVGKKDSGKALTPQFVFHIDNSGQEDVYERIGKSKDGASSYASNKENASKLYGEKVTDVKKGKGLINVSEAELMEHYKAKYGNMLKEYKAGDKFELLTEKEVKNQKTLKNVNMINFVSWLNANAKRDADGNIMELQGSGVMVMADFVNMGGVNDWISRLFSGLNESLFPYNKENLEGFRNKIKGLLEVIQSRQEDKNANSDVKLDEEFDNLIDSGYNAVRNKIADYYVNQALAIAKRFVEEAGGYFYRVEGSDEVYFFFPEMDGSKAKGIRRKTNTVINKISEAIDNYFESEGMLFRDENGNAASELFASKTNQFIPPALAMKGEKIDKKMYKRTGQGKHITDKNISFVKWHNWAEDASEYDKDKKKDATALDIKGFMEYIKNKGVINGIIQQIYRSISTRNEKPKSSSKRGRHGRGIQDTGGETVFAGGRWTNVTVRGHSGRGGASTAAELRESVQLSERYGITYPITNELRGYMPDSLILAAIGHRFGEYSERNNTNIIPEDHEIFAEIPRAEILEAVKSAIEGYKITNKSKSIPENHYLIKLLKILQSRRKPQGKSDAGSSSATTKNKNTTETFVPGYTRRKGREQGPRTDEQRQAYRDKQQEKVFQEDIRFAFRTGAYDEGFIGGSIAESAENVISIVGEAVNDRSVIMDRLRDLIAKIYYGVGTTAVKIRDIIIRAIPLEIRNQIKSFWNIVEEILSKLPGNFGLSIQVTNETLLKMKENGMLSESQYNQLLKYRSGKLIELSSMMSEYLKKVLPINEYREGAKRINAEIKEFMDKLLNNPPEENKIFERSYARRIREDDEVDAEIKGAMRIESVMYERLSNMKSNEDAQRILKEIGFNKAELYVKDLTNKINDAARVMLGFNLVKRFQEWARIYKNSGNIEQSEDYYRRAVSVAEFLSEYGTRGGQRVQAYSTWTWLDPAGVLIRAQRIISGINENKKGRLKGEADRQADEVREALELAHRAKIEEIINRYEKALNDAIEGKSEAESRLAEARAELEKQVNEYKKKISGFEEVIAILEQRLEDAKNKFFELQKDNAAKTADLQSVVKELSDLTSYKIQVEKQNQELNAKLKEAERKLQMHDARRSRRQGKSVEKTGMPQGAEATAETNKFKRIIFRSRRALKERANKEREKMKGYFNRLNVGLPVDALMSMAIIGADYILDVSADFAEWSKKMIEDFSENIRDYLGEIYEKAKEIAADNNLDSGQTELSIDDVNEFAAEILFNKLASHYMDKKTKTNNPLKQMIDLLYQTSVENGKIEVSEEEKKKQSADRKAKMSDKNLKALKEVMAKHDEFAKIYELAKQKMQEEYENNGEDYTQAIELLEKYFETEEGVFLPDSKMRQILKDYLYENKLEIRKIVRQHASELEDMGRSLKEKLAERLGLTDGLADYIAEEVDILLKELTEKAKKQEVERIIKQWEKRQNAEMSKRNKNKLMKLIELSNLGVFAGGQVAQAFLETFELKKLSADEAKKIEELAEKIQKSPLGSGKQSEAIQDVMQYINSLKGISVSDLAVAYIYGNVLAGFITQTKNVLSNMFNTLFEFFVNAIRHPWNSGRLIAGEGRGLWRGINEALYTLWTGYIPENTLEKYEELNVIENVSFKGNILVKFGKLLTTEQAKYVFRLMKAADLFFYYGLKEMRAAQLSFVKARGNKDLADIYLKNRAQDKADAEAQAEMEGYEVDSWAYKRRVFEILESMRDESIIEDSHIFATHGTFNHRPEGVFGIITDVMQQISNIPVGPEGFRAPFFKSIIMFTRILGNMVNYFADWSPLGFVRAKTGGIGWSSFKNTRYEGYYREYGKEERWDVLLKAFIGTVALTMSLMFTGGDDDDSGFSITGGGAVDWEKKQQLKNSGWQEYSFKFGDTYVSYLYFPIAPMLAVVGFINDNAKYNKNALEDKNFIEKVMIGTFVAASYMKDISFMQGLTDVMESITNYDKGAGYIKRITTNLSKYAIPGVGSNLTSQTARWIKEWFDVPEKDVKTDDFWKSLTGTWFKDLGIVMDSYDNVINALGDEVIIDRDIIFNKDLWDSEDEKSENPESRRIWKWIAEKNAYINTPKKNNVKLYDPIAGEDLSVTDHEYVLFRIERGRRLKEKLNKFVGSDMTKEQAQKAVRDAVNDANDETKVWLLGRKRSENVYKIMDWYGVQIGASHQASIKVYDDKVGGDRLLNKMEYSRYVIKRGEYIKNGINDIILSYGIRELESMRNDKDFRDAVIWEIKNIKSEAGRNARLDLEMEINE